MLLNINWGTTDNGLAGDAVADLRRGLPGGACALRPRRRRKRLWGVGVDGTATPSMTAATPRGLTGGSRVDDGMYR